MLNTEMEFEPWLATQTNFRVESRIIATGFTPVAGGVAATLVVLDVVVTVMAVSSPEEPTVYSEMAPG